MVDRLDTLTSQFLIATESLAVLDAAEELDDLDDRRRGLLEKIGPVVSKLKSGLQERGGEAFVADVLDSFAPLIAERAAIAREDVEQFEARRQSTAAGAVPESPRSIADRIAGKKGTSVATKLLLKMLDRGLTSSVKSLNQDTIASAVKRNSSREKTSKAWALLRKYGLITSDGSGAGHGTWLTLLGCEVAQELKKRGRASAAS